MSCVEHEADGSISSYGTDYFRYEYDEDGNLIAKHKYYKDGFDIYETEHYDTNGNLILRNSHDPDGIVKGTVYPVTDDGTLYEYDKDGYLICQIDSRFDNYPFEELKFLSEKEAYRLSYFCDQPRYGLTYTYDYKYNEDGLPIIQYRYNIKGELSSYLTYEYEYNKDGSPSVQTAYNQNGTFISSMQFQYEHDWLGRLRAVYGYNETGNLIFSRKFMY